MIKFLQHKSSRYPPRTFENASADATIAFAFDFNTPGEKLTKEAVITQGKIYKSIPAFFSSNDLNQCIEKLNNGTVHTINIAGNQLATVIKLGFNQFTCDEIVYDFLNLMIKRGLRNEINLIRSGGQSGFDESGLKAAVALGIPALCVCPQGWKFNDATGKTICDEQQFKNRFDQAIIL